MEPRLKQEKDAKKSLLESKNRANRKPRKSKHRKGKGKRGHRKCPSV